MQLFDLLGEAQARGVVLQVEGERLFYRPVQAMPPELLAEFRAHKAELLAILKVRHALSAGRRLNGRELRAETCLGDEGLYRALGDLYTWRELGTDLDGFYWLREPEVH